MIRPPAFRVAVAGKGGSGKSMIAGTLARLLARRGHQVLALDSDPLPGLAISLGIEPGDEPMLEAYSQQDGAGEWRLVRNLKTETIVRRAARSGPDGVLFLQFGKVRTCSPVPASSIQAFWGIATELPAGAWTIVHDLPAGTRQPFAGWAVAADVLLLVVEPTQKSILSARRLTGVTELSSSRTRLVGVVANKVRSAADLDMTTAAMPGVELIAAVPFDPSAAAADRDGIAPIDRDPGAPAVRAVDDLADRLESIAAESTSSEEGP